MSYAGVTLIAKLARGVSSFALAWWQCAVGTAALAAWPLLHGWPSWGTAWAWLAGLGVIHTGLAYVVLYAGMARLSTSRIALLQFVYPAAAVLIDWLVYGRTLSVLQVAGVALMAVALIGVQARRIAIGISIAAGQGARNDSPFCDPSDGWRPDPRRGESRARALRAAQGRRRRPRSISTTTTGW